MKYEGLWMLGKPELHEPVRILLKDEFGLVPPRPERFHIDRQLIDCNPEDSLFNEKMKLVYEENNVGIYRVDFYNKDTHPENPEANGLVWFRYWNVNFTPKEILNRDPMLHAIERVYDVFQPTRCSKSFFLRNDGKFEVLGRP